MLANNMIEHDVKSKSYIELNWGLANLLLQWTQLVQRNISDFLQLTSTDFAVESF